MLPQVAAEGAWHLGGVVVLWVGGHVIPVVLAGEAAVAVGTEFNKVWSWNVY